MAVPPKAAKIIAEAVLKMFAGMSYPWVPPKTTNGNGINNGYQQKLSSSARTTTFL